MIAQHSIEQLKSACNITDVVGQYVKLKKDGVNTVGLCPFHNEKSPSFKVSPTKNIYKCFGCGVSGDSIDFVMRHKNINYIEAVKNLAEFYKITLEEEIPVEKRTYVKPTPKLGELSQDFKLWFAKRGISEMTLNKLKVTMVNQWMPKAKTNVDTVCFNYFRNDELVNIKYRAKDKDFMLSKDAEMVFYNIDAIRGKDYAIIVEGEIDCLSVIEAGLSQVVSVPNGAANGKLKLEYLDTCWNDFKDKDTIVLFTDNDEAGKLLQAELLRRFGYDRCFKIDYPEGCKDANDILVKFGGAKILELLKNASEFPIEGILSVDELYADIYNFYHKGYPSGIKVGIRGFDDHIQLMAGQFTTVTGTPGAGKSEFVDFVMVETTKNHNWQWAVCSFENQPSSLHATKLMEKVVGKSFAKRVNPYDQMNATEMEQSLKIVNNNFYFININKIDVTLVGILEKAKELVLRKGIKGLLIDPWNYIEHKAGTGQTETQYISDCLTRIKAFAATHGIHIILVAHPTKMAKVGDKYEVPTMYNISGSAHFFNKTDNGITVYRDFSSGVVDVHIQKVRYSWLGKVGLCSFTYDVETRQYKAIGQEKAPF